MPHLTRPIDPIGGPFVRVMVTVTPVRRSALQTAGLPEPAPQIVTALVDTGASSCAVDRSVIEALDLSPTGSATVHTPSSGVDGHPMNMYDVALHLVHPESGHVLSRALPVLESRLDHQGFQMLLGRDLLESCLLVYDGATKTFALAF